MLAFSCLPLRANWFITTEWFVILSKSEAKAKNLFQMRCILMISETFVASLLRMADENPGNNWLAFSLSQHWMIE